MATNHREIITLQIGHYSNFVGTHFWNIQEQSFVYDSKNTDVLKEINHDILFREGQTIDGEVTYTPRLIAIDLKGSLNTLRKEGVLYDVVNQEAELNWPGDVTLHKTDAVHKNEFLRDLDSEDTSYTSDPSGSGDYHTEDEEKKELETSQATECSSGGQVFGPKLYNLDDDVVVWSDFLQLHLHPKTVSIVEEYSHDNALKPFHIFGYGQQVLEDKKYLHDLEDRLHFFAEECDQLQGFQLLVDTYNSFGGLASQFVQELEDEYSTKAIFTVGVSPPTFHETTHAQNNERIINSLLSYEKLTNHSSVLLPMSMATKVWPSSCSPVTFPYLDYKSHLNYHSSAILGVSLETVTLPWRRDKDCIALSYIADALTVQGRKVVSLQSSLPFPITETGTLMGSLVNLGDSLPWRSLTPYVNGVSSPLDITSQVLCLRGIPGTSIKGLPNPKMPRLLQNCSTAGEVLQFYLTEKFPSSLNAGCCIEAPSRVGSPFPHVFSKNISSEGFISEAERNNSLHGVNSVPMMAALQSDSKAAILLNCLHEKASRLDIKKFHKFLENGLEIDDYRNSLDSIQALSECYDVTMD